MKKILFTTAIGCLAASATLAAGPKVMLGGNLDTQYGMVSQADEYKIAGTPSSKDSHMSVESEIFIDVNGKVGNGLSYGAHLSLNGDISDSIDYENKNGVRQAYGYVESGFGHLQFGATTDAAEHMRVDASSIAVANGGIDGNFWKYINLNDLSMPDELNHPFYMKPGLMQAKGAPGAYGNVLSPNYISDIANANKISYYSPKVSGAQLGFTFTPDQDEAGGVSGFAPAVADGTHLDPTAGLDPVAGSSGITGTVSNTPTNTHTPMENVFDVSLGYEYEYKNVGLKLSAAYEGGTAKYKSAELKLKDDAAADVDFVNELSDLSSYNVGLMTEYMGMQFAGSFGQIMDTGSLKMTEEEVMYYTLGVAYATGPFRASATYLASTTTMKSGFVVDSSDSAKLSTAGTAHDYDFTNISLGLDYKLAPGFTPYVEANFFETSSDDATTAVYNDGSVFLIGMKVNF